MASRPAKFATAGRRCGMLAVLFASCILHTVQSVPLDPSPAAGHALLLHDQLLAPPVELSPDAKKLLEDYYRLGQQLPQPQRLGGVPADEGTAAEAAAAAAPSPWPQDPGFKRRAVTAGGDMEIWAYDVVSRRAVRRAATVVRRMLAGAPRAVRQRIRAMGTKLAIIGTRQNLTDLPPYRHLAGTTFDGRLWSTIRGVGPVLSNPVMAAGEEDILESNAPKQGFIVGESVLVHEMGHTVHLLGLGPCEAQKVVDRFSAAKASGAYSPESYMIQNEFEYFAMGQALFFDSTLNYAAMDRLMRYDRMRQRDPGLAELVEASYGSNRWRYPTDCPRCRKAWAWWLESDMVPAPGVVPYGGGGGTADCPCVDASGSNTCRRWRQAGLCVDPVTAQSCQLSCGLCSSQPSPPPPPPRPPSPPSPPPREWRLPCVDLSADCTAFVDTGQCGEGAGSHSWMMFNCRKSCNVCGRV